MEILTHKITGKSLMLKEQNGSVSTLWILDDNLMRIPDLNQYGRKVFKDGKIKYKEVIVLNTNLF